MITESYSLFRERRMRGETTCCEEVERALSRIEELRHLNAFITVTSELARQQARVCDEHFQRGSARPLEGMIIAIKDNISTLGIRTTCASRILENFVPVYNATVVERLIAAGAIIIGKTNLDEFAMGSSNETSFFGAARNPHNTHYVPGGSSGGSAIAVAAGMAHGALGSDTGGSIRQPAAFCGIVGYKPSYGRVSRYGLVAFASSLDQIGPLARTVADAAIISHVISGNDSRDSTSTKLPPISGSIEPFARQTPRPTIGIIRSDILEGCTPEIRQMYAQACHSAAEAGYELVEVNLFSLEAWIPTYYILATAEASSNLARYDGVRYGFRAENTEDVVTLTRTQGFGTEVKRRIMLGTYVLSAGYYDAYYRKAQQARRWIKENYRYIFQRCDAVVLPTTPTPPFRVGEKITDPLAMYFNDILTVSANLAGVPAISIPAGSTSSGLPLGIQLQTPHNRDDLLLRIAADWESVVCPALSKHSP